MTDARFAGFPPGITGFFAELARNNNKQWFDAHKQDYLELVKDPTQSFADVLVDRLADIAAGPPPRAWVFRINRDTRFSKDKTPYKTHVGVMFGDPAGKKDESPGFYFHLEPPTVMLGAGIYRFPKPLLEQYRASVADEGEGARLRALLDEVRASGPYEIWGETYKRVPQGYPADHPHAELLRYGGLVGVRTLHAPPELHGPALLDLCVEHFEVLAPIQRWLVGIMER